MSISSSDAAATKRRRVMIVDDHPIVRRGLADVIACQPDLEVCGEAAGVADAVDEVGRTRPDVVVIDLALKDGHGIELIEQIKARDEHAKMLVSSMHDETLFAERALRAGAMGYVSKQEPTENLLEAIRHVLRGEIYLSSRMTGRLLRHLRDGGVVGADPIAGLSDREIQVFEMIGQGLTTRQIARNLGLSPKTVETHRQKVKDKLNLKNSAELNRRAVQWVLENR
jgi:DNA-binding NarL/FixJ family response regulator